MNVGRDLQSKSAIYFKAFLFVVILVTAVILNLFDPRFVIRSVTLVLAVWAASRLYYFMFYVIENYVDNEYRFSGIYSFICYLLKKMTSPANKLLRYVPLHPGGPAKNERRLAIL